MYYKSASANRKCVTAVSKLSWTAQHIESFRKNEYVNEMQVYKTKHPTPLNTSHNECLRVSTNFVINTGKLHRRYF